MSIEIIGEVVVPTSGFAQSIKRGESDREKDAAQLQDVEDALCENFAHITAAVTTALKGERATIRDRENMISRVVTQLMRVTGIHDGVKDIGDSARNAATEINLLRAERQMISEALMAAGFDGTFPCEAVATALMELKQRREDDDEDDDLDMLDWDDLSDDDEDDEDDLDDDDLEDEEESGPTTAIFEAASKAGLRRDLDFKFTGVAMLARFKWVHIENPAVAVVWETSDEWCYQRPDAKERLRIFPTERQAVLAALADIAMFSVLHRHGISW